MGGKGSGRPKIYKTEEERRQAILKSKRKYNKAHREERIAYMKLWRKKNTELPDSEKPVLVRRCKEFEVCESAKQKGCKGCNIWNYLYNIKALQKWCKEHNKDFMLYTMEMHRKLKHNW